MKRSGIIFTLVWVLGFSAGAARAMDGLQNVLKEAAQRVASFIKEQKMTNVAIRDFTAPPKLQANFGNAISIDLQTNLKALGIAVDDKAAYEVVGKYRASTGLVAGAMDNFLLIEIEIFE